MMKTVFDFGMYDAADTEYFLEQGFKVVAVEANPSLCSRAETKLRNHLDSGALTIVNAALSDSNDDVELTICGDDLGSSSILEDAVAKRTPLAKWTVKGVTLNDLITKFGIPYSMKIDLEGMDAICVRALTSTSRPQFLSFETDGDTGLINHLAGIGFTKFKMINQCNFRELANQDSFRERICRRLFRTLGYSTPQYVRRDGRWFKTCHSSGPAPWCSDGAWFSSDDLIRRWRAAKQNGKIWGWYDVHAA